MVAGRLAAGRLATNAAGLLAQQPATFTVSRPLLEGRRVFDPATRHWVRPVDHSWDDLWQRLPRFRWIWWICTVIWGTAILADAVIRVIVAVTLPISVVPAIGGALWPVTFILLQVATNIFFARSGFWRILRTGALQQVGGDWDEAGAQVFAEALGLGVGPGGGGHAGRK